jgi:diguanylate cyclase (GGDEF)-like protein/PAS domain S-box-containing protein
MGVPWAQPEERRRLSAMLEHSSDMISVLDAEGHILFRSVQGILGYADGTLVGTQALDMVHPDDKDAAAHHLDRALRGQRPRPLELRVCAADGSWRWVDVLLTNCLNDPDVAGIVVNARDVTDRKRVQAATQGDAWFRSLVQNATDVTIVCDARGQPRYATPSLERITGYSLEDDAFRPDLVHPDDLEALIDAFERAREGPGLPIHLEFRVRHQRGDWRMLEASITHLLHDPHVAGIVVNARDITDRKQAEDALLRRERRWRALFENSSDLVSVFGADGKMTFSSGQLKLLGYAPEPDQDASALIDVVHPDDRDEAIQQLGEMFEGTGLMSPHSVRVRHADGSWRWIESMVNRLVDDPDVAGIVVNSRDITERKRAEDELRDQTLFVETLHLVGQTLAAELDLLKLVQAVTDAATDVSGAAFGAYFPGEGRSTDGGLAVSAVSGDERPFFAQPDLVNRALRGQGPLRGPGVLTLPVRSSSGEVLGALLCGHSDGRLFSDRAVRMVSGIAAQAAVALDNARLYEKAQAEIAARKEAEAQLAFAATHDPLTDLPNRTLFLDRLSMALARAARQSGAVGVLLFDLDRFKVVNDSIGHAAGDQLLMQVARRLGDVVRPGDTVARLGGDEFIMVCESLNGEIDAIGIADRVAEVLTEPFGLDEAEVSVTASIGIAVATDASRDPAMLVRDADAAMYRAKERGRSRWELFDEDLRTHAVQRLSVETSLRRAVERGELCVHYQPIVATADGSMVGAEALLRWNDPERGLIEPSEFIGIAEESGLIVPIGRLVFTEVARLVAHADGSAPPTVTVNLSARQLGQRDLVRSIVNILDETGADPHRLGLEITESVIMEDVDSAIAVLNALRDIGIRLWVDDFGTGYSSLAYLRRLPLNGVKIDRSFVAGLGKEAEDSAIVAGIVSLAHTLGMQAVAEGVETAEQMLLLRQLGCEFAQGYHWSPAVPPGDWPGALPAKWAPREGRSGVGRTG